MLRVTDGQVMNLSSVHCRMVREWSTLSRSRVDEHQELGALRRLSVLNSDHSLITMPLLISCVDSRLSIVITYAPSIVVLGRKTWNIEEYSLDVQGASPEGSRPH